MTHVGSIASHDAKYVAFCAIFGHQRIEIPISRTRFQYKCFLAQTLIQPYEMKIIRKLLPSEALCPPLPFADGSLPSKQHGMGYPRKTS